ncbi:GGDEF domain-containing protein [Undibacterium sp. CY18W]|uniref:diguanylate cyclase n=1 Tax=Undibacterium hunanense TaxID=2762292 RepID=A0ABR6ZM75_9BURK|nr:GGDEF domain-containing protein [Undibacterium hunanense]MBC3916664.1 GGDEF domain-containing protein [Undibacterium hunanense]
MPTENTQILLNARQQLDQLIKQIRNEGQQANLLPALETVLTQLDSMARHDHLTGALNRRSLMAMLDNELARSFRTGHTFTLASIAIDGLEQILEQHGQAVAKLVLQRVSKEALTMLRTLDSFGRVAANEFAIVMPTTWLEASRKAIARLKLRVEQVDWESIAPGLKVSFSTGLTTNAHKDTAESMLKRVGSALVTARTLGANQISEIEPPLPDYDPNADN